LGKTNTEKKLHELLKKVETAEAAVKAPQTELNP